MPDERESGFMGITHRLWGMGDWPEFEKYQAGGGGKGYEDWKRSGKPPPIAQITPYARGILERTGGVPPGVTTKEGGLPPVAQRVGTQQAEREVAGIDFMGGIKPVVRWETESQVGWDFKVGYDEEGNVVSRDVLGRTQEKEQLPEGMWKTFEEAVKGAPKGYRPKQTPEGWWGLQLAPQAAPRQDMPEGLFKTYQEAADAAPSGYTPVQQAGGWWGLQPPETVSPYQQQSLDFQQQQLAAQAQQQEQMLGWYREQAQMEQDWRGEQIRAQLSTQPQSWLDPRLYEGGQGPVVQPWMKPLMSQQYEVGAQLPGWTPEGGSAMPQLAQPSAQLFARMGPTAQAQFRGYQQSRTGIRPEEQEFRRRAAAPPGGGGGLRWTR